MLRPRYESLEHETRVLFDRIWREGGWTLYIDEGYFVEHELGLHRELIKLLTQGRSKYVSVVLGVQRPAWISRFAMSEPTHVLSSRLNDARDVKIIELMDGLEYAQFLTTLKKHQFGYMNREDDRMVSVNRDNVLEEIRK